MFKNIIILSFSLILSSVAFATECTYGKLLGFDDAGLFVSNANNVAKKVYRKNQARFIKGGQLALIKKAFNVKNINAAFSGADQGIIYKFEVPLNSPTDYEFLTVIYAYAGDTLTGTVFYDNSLVVVAELSDGDIMICEPALLN